MKKYITLLLLAVAGVFVSCEDDNLGNLYVEPSDDLTMMTIVDVLENDESGKYSEWLQLLKKTNYYNALKNASATATVFCPTNEAMDKFLADRNVESIDELDDAYAKAIVQTHIIEGTVTDSEVDDYAQKGSSISTQNLFNSYITLSYGYLDRDCDDVYRTNEVSVGDSIYLNNQARLGRFEATTCQNGTIFEMADVIKPLAETIYETLDADQDYSIFAEAIKECGYDSVANKYRDTTWVQGGSYVVNTYRYTCFAVPNEVYQQNGITDVASLKRYLAKKNTEDITDENLILNHYMQYHFLKREYTMDELFEDCSDDQTSIFEVRLSGSALVADSINGQRVINKDVPVVRSDIETRNGYITKVGGIMPVYSPAPVKVEWDFLNTEDIIAFVNAYGADHSAGNLFSSALTSSEYKIDLSDNFRDGEYGSLSSFSYVQKETKSSTSSYRIVGFCKDKYKSTAATTTSQYGCKQNNYLCLNLGYGGNITFTTPSIISGKYKIVLHYLSDVATQSTLYTSGTSVRFTLDNKSVTSLLLKGATYTRTNRFLNLTATLWGTYEFDGTSTHTFTVTLMDILAKTSSNYHLYLDYVEFVPVN